MFGITFALTVFGGEYLVVAPLILKNRADSLREMITRKTRAKVEADFLRE
jgi:hypothetical protein